MATARATLQKYSDGNLAAASIIAADPERYPEGSLMAQWADMVLTRAAPSDAECGPLFKAA